MNCFLDEVLLVYVNKLSLRLRMFILVKRVKQVLVRWSRDSALFQNVSIHKFNENMTMCFIWK